MTLARRKLGLVVHLYLHYFSKIWKNWEVSKAVTYENTLNKYTAVRGSIPRDICTTTPQISSYLCRELLTMISLCNEFSFFCLRFEINSSKVYQALDEMCGFYKREKMGYFEKEQ